MDLIRENLKVIRERISQSALKVGTCAEKIKLVAITKNVDVERIKQAVDCGVKTIGENKLQEASSKFELLPIELEKHLVGHLQTNKVKKAINLFDMIQSVDSLHLAVEISKRVKELNKEIPILIEVNTSGEKTKFGIEPEAALPLVEKISALENIKIQGLMTIGLWSGEEAKVRPCFVKLRKLFERIKQQEISGVEMNYLSMGMTGDFEWAILEGSNMVRIGTGIFGPREP
jgi:pyridoxal phosphate enzyme (YggS family)